MATTTPDGIYYPISTTQIAPLETQFSTLATSVQTAMTNKKQITVATAAALGALTLATYPNFTAYVSGNGTTWYNNGAKWELVNTPVVADATARDALYSGLATVSQGDTVFRNDLGYEQTYFAVYNSSTNAGGRASAGWYNNQRNMGLVPIVPPTVAVSGGSATANSLGVVSFTAATSISLNNVFSSAYTNYHMILKVPTTSATGNLSVKFRTGGVDNATGYYAQYWLMNRVGGTTQTNNGSSATGGSIVAFTTLTNRFISAAADINSPFATAGTEMYFRALGNDATGTYNNNGALIFDNTTSFDGITIYSTANMTGTIQILGYNA